MPERVLITGGAGFVGSHLADALVARGCAVRILDSLDPQVHGPERRPPAYLNPAAELIQGDVLDPEALWTALAEVDVVFHLAARVGVGQSMYEIESYSRVNVQGTALLLDMLANRRAEHRVRKILVASSMSIYGEGAYAAEDGRIPDLPLRTTAQLEEGGWELIDPDTGAEAKPVATPESKPLRPTSVYAIGKRDQEEMVLAVGRAYGLPAVALRYFNIYGPRQSLSNPYTGVAAIFASRILNGNPPVVYEDGLQSRDFIHVSDIVQANILAMENPKADYEVFNVGTGTPRRILELARCLAERLRPESNLLPRVEKRFRSGDVRHCFADIRRIRERLGYEPKVDFSTEGLDLLCQWAREQESVDRFDAAKSELDRRGLA